MHWHHQAKGRSSSGRWNRATLAVAPCLLALGLMAMACAPFASRLATPAPTPTSRFGLNPDNVVVDAWVDDPTPPLGSSVTVQMSLLNNGVPIDGLLMTAVWPQGGGLRTCHAQVDFDQGACRITVTDMEPGVYVPITVTAEYGYWLFTGLTGFTPQ